MSRLDRIQQWWRKASLFQRIAGCAALGCLALSVVFEPLLVALDPQLAVDAAYRRQGARESLFSEEWGQDPWGSTWSLAVVVGSKKHERMQDWERKEYEALATRAERDAWSYMPLHANYYSLGPNRVDEEGQGDDLLVGADGRLLDPSTDVLAWTGAGLATLGIALGWILFLSLFRTRSPRTGREVLVAAAIASGTCLVSAVPLAYFLDLNNWGPDWLEEAQAGVGEYQLLSPMLSAPLSAVLLVFMLALGWRLSGPVRGGR